MRPVIAIDQDQVLADLLTDWVANYNIMFNDSLDVDEINTWDMTKFVKPECGNKIFDLLNSYDLYRYLDVINGSQKVVKWLTKYFDVYIVTAATNVPNSLKAKLEWLNEHFDFIPTDNIVLCGDKSIIKADYMIDDGVHNLENFSGKGLLFDSPHNRYDHRFDRVNDWFEVKDYFVEVIKEAGISG